MSVVFRMHVCVLCVMVKPILYCMHKGGDVTNVCRGRRQIYFYTTALASLSASFVQSRPYF